VRSLSIIAAAALALAWPAQAQFGPRAQLAGPPAGTPPAEAAIWPFPPPDPNSWWDDKRPAAPEASDPLAGRRLARGERLITIDNGIDPATYRLWALMPLQWQVLRGDEMILEAWVRPARTVRQSVVRVIVRRDGRAFVQGRAGLACCEAVIGRRVGFDAELPAAQVRAFQALRSHPVWASPREVQVTEAGGVTADALCVDGTSYDLTLLVPGRSRHLHRACDDREVGQVADVLEPLLRAALGREPRFDVTFPRGVDFSSHRAAYQELVAAGGALTADPNARPQPPGFEPAPVAEP
jgi:hypothetical protein